MEAESEGVCGCFAPPPKEGPTLPISDDDNIKCIIALPGAMAAGIASRYKTGPQLET